MDIWSIGCEYGGQPMASTKDPLQAAYPDGAQTSRLVERRPSSDERTRREERLLDAATNLLVRWGYRKTTIDDVAREAGVGKGQWS